jgi:hypothetical protein
MIGSKLVEHPIFWMVVVPPKNWTRLEANAHIDERLGL